MSLSFVPLSEKLPNVTVRSSQSLYAIARIHFLFVCDLRGMVYLWYCCSRLQLIYGPLSCFRSFPGKLMCSSALTPNTMPFLKTYRYGRLMVLKIRIKKICFMPIPVAAFYLHMHQKSRLKLVSICLPINHRTASWECQFHVYLCIHCDYSSSSWEEPNGFPWWFKTIRYSFCSVTEEFQLSNRLEKSISKKKNPL